MKFLTRLIDFVSGRTSHEASAVGVTPPPQASAAAPSYSENRLERRVALGSRTQLYRRDSAPVPCVVTDASREGIRIVADEPIAPNAMVGVVVHFNGYFLRMRARVVWTRESDGVFEAGAQTLGSPVEDGGLMDMFVRYLRWRDMVNCAS